MLLFNIIAKLKLSETIGIVVNKNKLMKNKSTKNELNKLKNRMQYGRSVNFILCCIF